MTMHDTTINVAQITPIKASNRECVFMRFSRWITPPTSGKFNWLCGKANAIKTPVAPKKTRNPIQPANFATGARRLHSVALSKGRGPGETRFSYYQHPHLEIAFCTLPNISQAVTPHRYGQAELRS